MSIHDIKLESKGWYPACQCWDCEEGASPCAVYFDGILITKCVEFISNEINDCSEFNHVFEDYCCNEDLNRALELADWLTDY